MIGKLSPGAALYGRESSNNTSCDSEIKGEHHFNVMVPSIDPQNIKHIIQSYQE
jgi:hypothetical protein